jgi:hypothetical protein
VTRKITRAVAAISLKKQECVVALHRSSTSSAEARRAVPAAAALTRSQARAVG